ncbi:hypothetical protein KGP36_05870 [Patescibacteria group bacterium]|nr:hypothetical protein [Patescibacteria group bacterium]
MLIKAKTCVVHLTTVAGSMQASARLARFLADTIGVALVDDADSMFNFIRSTPCPAYGERDLTLIFVNGPIAFCGYRDEMGSEMLPRTQRVYWVSQDYTITMPPNQAYSRPTKAETPFRAEFHKIPHVHLWSTCQDVLQRRQQKRVPGYELDEYVNWNALTYAPMPATPAIGGPIYPHLLYYGALRAGRTARLGQFFGGVSDRVSISASNLNKNTAAQWRELAPQARITEPLKGVATYTPTNGNKWGAQRLTQTIAMHRHSLYVADEESNTAFHSLANRFYEVLSTPYTVLWLDAAGARTYEQAGLRDWEQFTVGDGHGLSVQLSLPAKNLRSLAAQQRKLWLATDPFKILRDRVKQLARSL